MNMLATAGATVFVGILVILYFAMWSALRAGNNKRKRS